MTEDAEPQEEFDLGGFTPYLLNIASELESLEFSEVYKSRYGMNRPEWRVLFHLGRYGEMTATEIGRRARIHKTKISRAVQALEVKRFLARAPQDGDRRFEVLSLRPPGLAAYRDLTRQAALYETALEARLGGRDARRLREILQRLIAAR